MSQIRKPYGKRTRVQVDVGGESLTRQSHKDECDINNIVQRYERTGVLTSQARGVPQYLDVSEVKDYRHALDQVRAAQEYFMQLPASLRRRFDNDAAEFVDFVNNPANWDELQELGMAPGAAPTANPTVNPDPLLEDSEEDSEA